jgi:acyl dehydratase
VILDDVREGQPLPKLSYDITSTTVVLGALAARDWRPMHHDKDFAVNRNGTRHIFLSTPHQAAWFERYITDWTGPKGRLGRITFRMKGSVFPNDTMVMEGVVRKVEVDDGGCGWAEVDVTMSQNGQVCTQGSARIAMPTTPDDNPWARRAERWRP